MKTIAGIELYDVEDIAKQWGWSSFTARRYFREGRIKGRKIGRRWYATREAIQDFIERDPTK